MSDPLRRRRVERRRRAPREALAVLVAGLCLACASHEPAPLDPAIEAASVADPAIAAIDRYVGECRAAGRLGSDAAGSRGWRTMMPTPPPVEPVPGARYHWILETSEGPLDFLLLADAAPRHVISTIYLTRAGFYDGLTFHRVIRRFMAQGGDPAGRGTGGPGYRYDGEFDPSARHDARGTLSMANAGPGTDGSQFFVTFQPTPFLDGKHTVFGKLVPDPDTVETLDSIEALGAKGEGPPSKTITILRASIRVDGGARVP